MLPSHFQLPSLAASSAWSTVAGPSADAAPLGALSAVVIGQIDREEFQPAATALHELTRLVAVVTVEAAAKLMTGRGFVPDLIVFAQSRPGEFSTAQVDRLRRLAPLARVVGLLGPWCEGETRTGRPWPGVIRVNWYHWLPQSARAVAKLLQGQCPSWGLPPTANDDDRLLAAAAQPLPRRRGLVVISAPHRATYESLSTACASSGYHTEWVRSDQPAAIRGATAALWVGGDLGRSEVAVLRRFASQLPGVPVVALLDFPRVSTCERARACGAAAVVARPFQLEDLIWQLDRVQGVPLLGSAPAQRGAA